MRVATRAARFASGFVGEWTVAYRLRRCVRIEFWLDGGGVGGVAAMVGCLDS